MPANGFHINNGIDAYAVFSNVKAISESDNGTQFNNHTTSDHVLELRNVSYIRSFSTGRWYAKLFNPPVTAQFLKDITFNVYGGEIMGIVGAGGCGKTTLLNVIARRTQGTTGGTIVLNHRATTERSFQNSCAYVSFKQHFIKQLTVESTLKYHAELGLARTLTGNEKMKRVKQLIRDFELVDQAEQKVMDINESSRRRLLIAIHAIRDPVMILIDEPSRDIDPLSAYQLMSTLSQYVRKYHRIALVTMSIPRSDIYPLLDRLTILFFGEIVYSGYTKMMPQYLRNFAFPCPASENPAVYFLSLASVDRETSERYVETQDQAVKLIEIFKADGEIYSCSVKHQADNRMDSGPYLPLCQLGRPNCARKLIALIKRNTAYFLAHWRLLLCRLFGLPLFATILFSFYFQIQPSSTVPLTIAGLIFNCLSSFSTVTVALTAASFSSLRTRYYQDSWDNLYGGGIFIISYLFTTIFLDFLSVFGATAILYWGCKLARNLTSYLLFSVIVCCCCQFAQLHTICVMLFVKSAYKSATTVILLLSIYITSAGGFLKNISTYAHSLSDLLNYLTHASIYRYAGAFLQHQQLANVTTGCKFVDNRHQLNSASCRWETGMDYLNEIYHMNDYEHPFMNVGICIAYVACFTVFTVVLYSLPMPHFIKRKFRYK